MPEPAGRGQRYLPGLDGLRAVAVLGVVAYHLGAGWAQGGLLGVGVFFTLSGYLITDLLLGGWRRSGALSLGDFWLRRARRLLPGLALMLAVVSVWVAIGDPSQLGDLRGSVAAAAVYLSNWWLIAGHASYFARFGPPTPLGHLWSLAVEEQFYLVWPWLLAGGLWWARRPPREGRSRRLRSTTGRLRVLAVVTVGLAVLSAIEMGLLHHPSVDPTRVYDGTDTRAFGLLLGAALAMVWPSRAVQARLARWSSRSSRLLEALGSVGLAGIFVLFWRTSAFAGFLYPWGMVLLSLATLLVITSATLPRGLVSSVLGCRPLRWIGLISYGIYLWHYPIIVLTTPTPSRGLDVGRAILQVGATIVVAALSWYLVESPIRSGVLGRWWRGTVRTGGALRTALRAPGARLGAGLAVLGTGTAALAIAGLLPAASPGVLTADGRPGSGTGLPGDRTIRVDMNLASSLASPVAPRGRSPRPSLPPDGHRVGGAGQGDPPATATAAPRRTSCRSVVFIGDSTSESLVSDAYLDPNHQLPAQLQRVGVQSLDLQIAGARSLVETYDGQPNGMQVAQQVLAGGYRGCWVIALGTNDAANVAVGGVVSMSERIQHLMSLLGGQPVMWVNVVSELTNGPYSEQNMALWNQDLLTACGQYPDMRVFDWASMVQPQWFVSDGIHYDTPGSAVRAAAMADALANAFPAGSVARTGPPGAADRRPGLHERVSSCVVSATP